MLYVIIVVLLLTLMSDGFLSNFVFPFFLVGFGSEMSVNIKSKRFLATLYFHVLFVIIMSWNAISLMFTGATYDMYVFVL